MKKFATGSAAIGFFQIADAAILYSNGGVCGEISTAFSFVEFLWAIAALVVIIRVKHLPTRLLAIAFFFYNLVGWVVAASMFDYSVPLVVPLGFILWGGVFGTGYAAASIHVAKQP